MGWTEEQLMVTTLPALEVAYRGRMKMLRMVVGGSAPGGVPSETVGPSLTPKLLNAMVNSSAKASRGDSSG